MADDRRLARRAELRVDRGTLLVAGVVLCVGLAGAGAGFVNGDAAVYAAQGWQGDVSSRPVHFGYVALAALLAPLAGDALPTWLDGLSALACAATVLAAGAFAGSMKHRVPWVAAAVSGALLLPLASFAEVDPLWTALLAWAVAVPGAGVAALLTGLATLFSPLALLGLLWVSMARWARALERVRDTPGVVLDVRMPNGGLWLVPLVVVVALSVGSGLEWWTGDRGVLAAPAPRLVRALQAWAGHAVPWASLPLIVLGWVTGGGVGTLAALLLLVAPPDTAAWGPLAFSLALLASRGATTARAWGRPGWALIALVGIDLLLGGMAWRREGVRVRTEQAQIAQVLAAMGPDDGLVAPWTWGARASVLATRDPYALMWRVPGPPVRDPQPWCNRVFTRIHVLPPDLVLPDAPLPGCRTEAPPERPPAP